MRLVIIASGAQRAGAAALRRRRLPSLRSNAFLSAFYRAYATSHLVSSSSSFKGPSSTAAGDCSCGTSAVVLTSRRFVSSSSQAATTSTAAHADAEATASRVTRLRHRRGAHRKRGGGASEALAAPAPSAIPAATPPPSPALNGAEKGVGGGGGGGEAKTMNVVEPTVAPAAEEGKVPKAKKLKKKSAMMMMRKKAKAAAVDDGEEVDVMAEVNTAVDDDLADEAAAIMQQLISSPKLNGHHQDATLSDAADSAVHDDVDDIGMNSAELSAAASVVGADTATSNRRAEMEEIEDQVEAVQEEKDEDDEVVGVQLSKHRRNSRSRSSKRRRGSQDGTTNTTTATAAVDTSSPPTTSTTATAAAATTTTTVASAASEEEDAAVSAAEQPLDAPAEAPAAVPKPRRGRKPKRSAQPSSPLPTTTTTTAPATTSSAAVDDADAEMEEVDLDAFMNGEKAHSSAPAAEVATAAKEESAAADAASNDDASTAAAAAIVEEVQKATTAPASGKRSMSARSRRGKRGRASVPTDSGTAATTTSATAAAAEDDSTKASVRAEPSTQTSVKAPKASTKNLKKAGDVAEEETEAAVPQTHKTETAEVKEGLTASAEAVQPAPASDVKEGAFKEKKRRGRKKRAAATPTPTATPTTSAAPSPAAASAQTAEDGPVITDSDLDELLQSTPAEALKKLLAATSNNSNNNNTATTAATSTGTTSAAGSAAVSLAAKKRLAAQIIRRRWQLQQEAKNRPAGVAAAVRDSATPASAMVAAKPAATAAVTAAVTAAEAPVAVERTSAVETKKPKGRRGRPRKIKRGADGSADPQSEKTAAPTSASPEAEPEGSAVKEDKESADATKAAAAAAAAREAARDADVAAAVAAAIATMPKEHSSSAPAADVHVAGAEKSSNAAVKSAGAASGKATRSLAKLVARSHTVVSAPNPQIIHNADVDADGAEEDGAMDEDGLTVAAARGGSGKSSKGSSGGDKGASTSGGNNNSGNNNNSGGSKGANSKDTLYFPDYRERVVQIFEQMAEINNALGERYKSISYSNSVERLKRGDKVFQLLPPNLLPLPEDSPKWKAPVVDDQTDPATAAAVQRRARDVEENRAKRSMVTSSDNLLPGVGQKLQVKIAEILTTGDLAELHVLEAKPLIRAIRELTQVHGFGPRTAIEFYKKYNITTVKELQEYAVKKGELDMSNKATGKPAGLVSTTGSAHRAGFHLNDAQRLGLVYHKDMSHRIPHDEGRLHEAFLKLRLRKYLGKDYELVVCGSYRRQVEASGDIDVLLTRKRTLDGTVQNTAESHLPPSEVLATFLNGLKTDRYIEATLAQGPTKFMGLCRLRALAPPAASGKAAAAAAAATPAPRFRARRLDVRYVDISCFPAAMLYFTGSKNFNVIMRSEAIKKHCILNEYGLFRKFTRKQQLQRQVNGGKPYNLHEMVTRLARFGFASIKDVMEKGGSVDAAAAAGEEEEEDAEGATSGNGKGGQVTSAGKKIKKKSKEKTKAEMAELCEIAKIVEKQRVKAFSEKEIFDALDMDYVQPKDRNV